MSSRAHVGGVADPASSSERSARSEVAAGARLWEVDLARTVAILMMVAYHIGWDLDFLAPQLGVDPFSGWWRGLQVVTGTSFLLLVGVSVAISQGRSGARGRAGWPSYRRHARRAATVLMAALVVSLATFVALGPDGFVRFGILHLIGVTMLILPLVWALGAWAAVVGVGAIAAGLAIRGLEVGTSWVMWLGLRPDGATGVDYYPLLPWIGPALIGLALGRYLYPDGRRGRLTARLGSARSWSSGVRFGSLGRHSLPIYLAHQPILIMLVTLLLLAAGVQVELVGLG